MKNNFSKKPIFINKQEFEIAKNMLLYGNLNDHKRAIVEDIFNCYLLKKSICKSIFICFCEIYDDLFA
jgi:hypothetical protein